MYPVHLVSGQYVICLRVLENIASCHRASKGSVVDMLRPLPVSIPCHLPIPLLVNHTPRTILPDAHFISCPLSHTPLPLLLPSVINSFPTIACIGMGFFFNAQLIYLFPFLSSIRIIWLLPADFCTFLRPCFTVLQLSKGL